MELLEWCDVFGGQPYIAVMDDIVVASMVRMRMQPVVVVIVIFAWCLDYSTTPVLLNPKVVSFWGDGMVFLLLLQVKIDRESQNSLCTELGYDNWFILFAHSLSTVNVVWLTQSWIVYATSSSFLWNEWHPMPDSMSYVAPCVVCRVVRGGGVAVRGVVVLPVVCEVWSLFRNIKYVMSLWMSEDGVTSW